MKKLAMGPIYSIAKYADMPDQVMDELAERRTAVEDDEKLWRCFVVTGAAEKGYLWIAGANEKR